MQTGSLETAARVRRRLGTKIGIHGWRQQLERRMLFWSGEFGWDFGSIWVLRRAAVDSRVQEKSEKSVDYD